MESLDRCIDEFLAETFADTPSAATHHGVAGHDTELPDLSADAHLRRYDRDDEWLARFEAMDSERLEPAERIDRALLVATLRGRQAFRTRSSWQRTADTYVGAALAGLFTLLLRRPLPDRELADAAIARLDGVESLLAAGRANLEPGLMPPILLERSLRQCQAGITYFRDLVPTEVAAAEQSRVAEAGERAADHLRAFGAHLESIAGDACGDFAFGAEAYSSVLTDAELLGVDVDGVHRRGRDAYADLEAQMVDLADRISPGAGWRATIEQINTDHPSSPDEMRAGYEQATADARAFLVERGLVTFLGGEQCDVVPSPHFQRPMLAVASYIQPPSFKPSRSGRFNVPYPPDGVDADEVRKRLSNNSWAAMPTISVHEAYPGHHWHLVTAMQARPIRRVLRSTYFTEGWALYTEKMMRDEGFFTDLRAELCHLDFRLFRAARIIVDTALHTGRMTVDEAVDFMHTKASLSEPNARAEVVRYCATPTQASSYLTGSLEIERLRDRWFAEARGDLRAFHDTIAASGALPVALAERVVFDD